VTELSIPAIRIPWAHLDFSIARLGAVSIDSGCKMWRMLERAVQHEPLPFVATAHTLNLSLSTVPIYSPSSCATLSW
jgi:hypothetical protein